MAPQVVEIAQNGLEEGGLIAAWGKEISRKNTRCQGLGVMQCADRCASKVNQPDAVDCYAKLFAHVLNK
jgi:hypothetical protein